MPSNVRVLFSRISVLPLPAQRAQCCVVLRLRSARPSPPCDATVRALKLSLVCCITDSRVNARAPFGPRAGHPMPEVRLLGVREDDLLVLGVRGKIHLSEIHRFPERNQTLNWWNQDKCLLPLLRDLSSTLSRWSRFLWHRQLCFLLTHVNFTPSSPTGGSMPSLFLKKKKKKNRYFFSRNNQSN